MESYFGSYTDCLSIVGASSLIFIAFWWGRVALRVLSRTVRRSFDVELKQFGRWAVITGSTDGIGKSYALQLAEKGMDVVLISRSPQKLAAVAEEIVSQYKVAVKTVTADFTKTDVYERIKQELSGLDVGILVNNVGMSNAQSPEYYCDADDFEHHNKDIINVNVMSCVVMTGIVLPEMLERKRGTIINISSGAGLRPMPFFAMYSSTKAFMSFFSQALNLEYASQGVTIQVVYPHMVKSNMSIHVAKSQGIENGLMFPTSDQFVRKAIRTIGHESTTIPHWPHELQQCFGDLLSDAILTKVLLYTRNKFQKFLKTQ